MAKKKVQTAIPPDQKVYQSGNDKANQPFKDLLAEHFQRTRSRQGTGKPKAA